TITCGFEVARNPKEAASGDSPSSTRIVPCSMRSVQSAAEPVVPGGATVTASPEPLTRPIDESTAGQPPSRSPRTRYENPPAETNDAESSSPARLFRKDIPDSCAHIVEVGPSRIAGVDQVRAAQRIDRKPQRHAPAFETKSDAWAG